MPSSGSESPFSETSWSISFRQRVRTHGIGPPDINFENATQSLFWTGFSVPLLTLVKLKTETVFTLIQLANPVLQQIIRFFVICFTNGAYIAIHNRFRGFNEKVIKANFFRSVFAWPPATLFSFLGDIFLVPSIVQAKFWSDFMAALIEGIGKSTRQFYLSKRDLLEILPQIVLRIKRSGPSPYSIFSISGPTEERERPP